MKRKYKLIYVGAGLLALVVVIWAISVTDIGTGGLSFGNDIDTFKARVTVGEYVGFETTDDLFEFGTIKPASSSQKQATITNKNPDSKKVRFSVVGDIAPLISVSDNLFVLEPGESVEVTVSVVATSTTSFGDYSGKVSIEYLDI